MISQKQYGTILTVPFHELTLPNGMKWYASIPSRIRVPGVCWDISGEKHQFSTQKYLMTVPRIFSTKAICWNKIYLTKNMYLVSLQLKKSQLSFYILKCRYLLVLNINWHFWARLLFISPFSIQIMFCCCIIIIFLLLHFIFIGIYQHRYYP